MKIDEISTFITSGLLDGVFEELYLDQSAIELQRQRYLDALDKFEKLYGAKEVEVYSSPGRTEIGGNHTDHQGGKVLAASINLDAIAVVAKIEEPIVKIKSEGYPYLEINLNSLLPVADEEGRTEALVRGVANGFVDRGFYIGGFEAYITSDVLGGSGLSSSACYEVLMGNIFSGLYNQRSIDAITIAKIGREAEMRYFGKPCGLMDQMACSVGGMIYIDFADKEQPDVKKLNVDFSKFHHCLCIVDTKGSHEDLTDDYAAVPAEMKQVARYYGKEVLCDVDRDVFYMELADVVQQIGDRAVLRSMHWFEENARVEQEVNALEKGDFDSFKNVVEASGESSFKLLQNIFSTKNPQEQKVSLALALSDSILKHAGVSRVHGGGFAGTIQAFVPKEIVKQYKQKMEKVFGNDSCYILQIRPDGGRKII